MAIEHTVKICDKETTVTLTPIKAIRLACMDCSAGSYAEVKTCHIKTCPLYPYRMGKNPTMKGRGAGKHVGLKTNEQAMG